MTKTAKMDKLPSDIYGTIFDNLHLIDLARLKQVCKKLRSIVQNYRIRELVISPADVSLDILTSADGGEYQNSCIIKPQNLKRTMPYRIYVSSLKNSLFDPKPFFHRSVWGLIVEFSAYDILLRSPQFNVQFLKSLTCPCSDSSDSFRYLALNEVNKFVLLERLEITLRNPENFDHGKLSLPNLRTLLLVMDKYNHFKMEVEAPKCEGFHLRSTLDRLTEKQNLRVQFGNPLSVKYLSLYDYHESSHVFKNIEFLQVVLRANFIDEQSFAAFPHLKTLKIIEHNSLKGLRQLFWLSRRRNVKLVFHGIPLVDGNELDSFEESDFENPSFFHKASYKYLSGLLVNYDRLEEDLNFLKRINFSEKAARLLEADAGRFLRIFNNLYFIISKIKIGKSKLFLRFLTSCKSLRNLQIINSGMGQQCFEELANIKTLSELHIEEDDKIDLSFIFKLPILWSLVTNHDIDLKGEIKLDKLDCLQIGVIKGEFCLNLIKSSLNTLHNGMNRRYMVYKVKETDYKNMLLRNTVEIEYLKSFEDLVRRYEELKNEDYNFYYYENESELIIL